MATRSKGQGNVFLRNGIWHIRYWDGREQIRESARAGFPGLLFRDLAHSNTQDDAIGFF